MYSERIIEALDSFESWEELMASATGPQGSLIMLWAGEDPALHAALVEELEEAGILYIDRPTGDDQIAPPADILPIDWKAQFGFEVAVPSSSLGRRRRFLKSCWKKSRWIWSFRRKTMPPPQRERRPYI